MVALKLAAEVITMNQLVRQNVFATALAVAAFSSTGCGNNSTSDLARQGILDLHVDGAGNVVIDAVSYGLTGPAGYSKTGAIDVRNSPVVSALIGGIPAGTGYSITLSATSRDQGTTCTGTAGFDVLAHTTTAVAVHLSCRQQPRTGSVSVNGTFNICPMIDSLGANPAAVPLGGTIAASVSAHDDGIPSALTYTWTSTSGSFSNASIKSPIFTCSQVGAATLSLTVSDGDCADTSTLTVSCTLPAGATMTLVPLGCSGL